MAMMPSHSIKGICRASKAVPAHAITGTPSVIVCRGCVIGMAKSAGVTCLEEQVPSALIC